MRTPEYLKNLFGFLILARTLLVTIDAAPLDPLENNKADSWLLKSTCMSTNNASITGHTMKCSAACFQQSSSVILVEFFAKRTQCILVFH